MQWRNFVSTFLFFGLFLLRGQMSESPLGLVFDEPSRTVRGLYGFPGATYWGAPLRTGLEAASVSSDGKWIVAQLDGRTALFSSAALDVEILSLPMTDHVVWSEDSRSFALLRQDDAVIEWRKLRNGAWESLADTKLAGSLRLLALDGDRDALWVLRRLDSGLGEAENSEALQDKEMATALLRVSAGDVSPKIVASGSYSLLHIPKGGSEVLIAAAAATGAIERFALENGSWSRAQILNPQSPDWSIAALRLLADGSILSAWNWNAKERPDQGAARILRYGFQGELLDEPLFLDTPVESFVAIPGSALLRLPWKRESNSQGLTYFYVIAEKRVYFVPAWPRGGE